MLIPFDAADAPMVADWLADPGVHEWMDFGAGVQSPGELALRAMAQRDVHLIRLVETGGRPVGIVALSDIDRSFRTANLWFALGDPDLGGQGHTTRGVSEILTEGFDGLGLVSVGAWTVEGNRASQRVLEKSSFRVVGRRRRCHRIGSRWRDRLLFDLLAEEHLES